MTIWQCMLVATLIIPIVYFYRVWQLYKDYMHNFKEIVTLNYLFLMTYCSLHKEGEQIAFSARFVECEVFEDYAGPLQRLIEDCVMEKLIVFDHGTEGTPLFHRQKLLAKVKKLKDEAMDLVEGYKKQDAFTRYLLSRVQEEHKATYEKLVEEYAEIEKHEDFLISYY